MELLLTNALRLFSVFKAIRAESGNCAPAFEGAPGQAGRAEMFCFQMYLRGLKGAWHDSSAIARPRSGLTPAKRSSGALIQIRL